MNILVDANGWPIPPTVLLGCLVAGILYFRGWRVLVQQERVKETPSPVFSGFIAGKYRWNSWFLRGIYFFAAILVFLLAASSPVDVLSGRLFWVHMVQHLLLLVIMAPLLVAGAPLLPVWLGLPNRVRELIKALAKPKIGHVLYQMGRLVGHWLLQPAISCALLIIAIWIWHWPPFYDFALTHDAIHDWGEHLTFQAVSVLFWMQVIPMPPFRTRLNYIGRIGCVGFAIAQNLILAVLIAFAQVPLYAFYAHAGTISGGLSALQDQQFGAGIMWTFGDFPFGIAISILVHRWLISQSDDESPVNAREKQSA